MEDYIMFVVTKILEKLFSNLIYRGTRDAEKLYDQLMTSILTLKDFLDVKNQRILEDQIRKLWEHPYIIKEKYTFMIPEELEDPDLVEIQLFGFNRRKAMFK